MKFGVFDHMDASGEPLAHLFENRLKLAEAYPCALPRRSAPSTS